MSSAWRSEATVESSAFGISRDMKRYPEIPRLDDAPDEPLESGHLWLTELIDGLHMRVQLRESGLLRVGDRMRVYDDPDEIPASYRHAVRYVRERLDRRALRAAVDDVESIVLFGVATNFQRIEYDWTRLPSFLGVDVWSADTASFRPPDVTEKVFERLGLTPVNAFERERNTRDFDPDRYTIPESEWYDGPAAGVVIRNKTGGRAKLLHSAYLNASDPPPLALSAAELAEQYATDRRFERIESELRERGEAVSFEALYERMFESIVRETHSRLFAGGSSVDVSVLRSEIAERTGEFL